MAYHHHPCHRAITAAACYCHCYCATCTPCPHHPPPPPDSYLHHPPYQPHFYSSPSHLPQYQEHFQGRYFREKTQTHPTISSLLRRIAALESALRRRSSDSQSLRDAAARTIQTHFRAFLSRRSRTLRQLKVLASIKSILGILKSSVSGKTHFDYGAVYHKAMKLLLKLNTIQGDDPMVRNGKSSISKELNKFLNFIEGISSGANVRYPVNVKKSWVSNRERKNNNVTIGNLKKINVEKMRVLAERIDKLAEELDEEPGELIENSKDLMIRKNGVSESRRVVQPKVKKSVTFAENGKVYEVLRGRNEPFLKEGCSESIDRDNDEGELEDDLCREIEEMGVFSKDDGGDDDDEEVHSENGGSLADEKDSRSYLRCEEDNDDEFVFSPPLPVKMEKRGH
ncbi:hypothetical protein CDL12_28064 [Handroanthus impetiginosus]|uniref:BAG domain-containing protein n=1 Tax=Handroanthus impetiginosus TaxID=429701 RepID=A0A2G9G298_9LAMI|nr:hypothetical protein CDL12_28064 [Handroanthus impetiginosus]